MPKSLVRRYNLVLTPTKALPADLTGYDAPAAVLERLRRAHPGLMRVLLQEVRLDEAAGRPKTLKLVTVRLPNAVPGEPPKIGVADLGRVLTYFAAKRAIQRRRSVTFVLTATSAPSEEDSTPPRVTARFSIDPSDYSEDSEEEDGEGSQESSASDEEDEEEDGEDEDSEESEEEDGEDEDSEESEEEDGEDEEKSEDEEEDEDEDEDEEEEEDASEREPPDDHEGDARRHVHRAPVQRVAAPLARQHRSPYAPEASGAFSRGQSSYASSAVEHVQADHGGFAATQHHAASHHERGYETHPADAYWDRMLMMSERHLARVFYETRQVMADLRRDNADCRNAERVAINQVIASSQLSEAHYKNMHAAAQAGWNAQREGQAAILDTIRNSLVWQRQIDTAEAARREAERALETAKAGAPSMLPGLLQMIGMFAPGAIGQIMHHVKGRPGEPPPLISPELAGVLMGGMGGPPGGMGGPGEPPPGFSGAMPPPGFSGATPPPGFSGATPAGVSPPGFSPAPPPGFSPAPPPGFSPAPPPGFSPAPPPGFSPAPPPGFSPAPADGAGLSAEVQDALRERLNAAPLSCVGETLANTLGNYAGPFLEQSGDGEALTILRGLHRHANDDAAAPDLQRLGDLLRRPGCMERWLGCCSSQFDASLLTDLRHQIDNRGRRPPSSAAAEDSPSFNGSMGYAQVVYDTVAEASVPGDDAASSAKRRGEPASRRRRRPRPPN